MVLLPWCECCDCVNGCAESLSTLSVRVQLEGRTEFPWEDASDATTDSAPFNCVKRDIVTPSVDDTFLIDFVGSATSISTAYGSASITRSINGLICSGTVVYSITTNTGFENCLSGYSYEKLDVVVAFSLTTAGLQLSKRVNWLGMAIGAQGRADQTWRIYSAPSGSSCSGWSGWSYSIPQEYSGAQPGDVYGVENFFLGGNTPYYNVAHHRVFRIPTVTISFL